MHFLQFQIIHQVNGTENKNGRENTGKPWSEDEESQLLEEYHSGLKVKEIAKAHERSNGAITSKLAKLIAE